MVIGIGNSHSAWPCFFVDVFFLSTVVDEPLIVREGKGHDVRRVRIISFDSFWSFIINKSFFQSLQEVLDTAISVGQKRWNVSPEEAAQRVMKYLIIIVILPDKAALIRTSVKHWGDVEKGMF